MRRHPSPATPLPSPPSPAPRRPSPTSPGPVARRGPRAIAGMQTDSQIAFEALDDDPLFAAYRNRVAEAIDALPEWSDRYLLSLRRGEVEATTALVAEFPGRTALANAELEAAVADV